MGVTRPEIRVTADPALLLHPAPPERVDGWFLRNNLDPQCKYLMMVLRPWKGFEEKAPVFAAVAETIRQRHGIKPLFLALEPGRDLPACTMAARCLQPEAPVLPVPDDGAMIVGVLGRMQAVISMRLHALIFAAAAGTPVVGAVYDPKVQAFLDYLGKKRYLALEDVTEEGLLQLVEDALNSGADDGKTVEHLRELAAENEAMARKLLEEA